jgi:hypothetical protein
MSIKEGLFLVLKQSEQVNRGIILARSANLYGDGFYGLFAEAVLLYWKKLVKYPAFFKAGRSPDADEERNFPLNNFQWISKIRRR